LKIVNEWKDNIADILLKQQWKTKNNDSTSYSDTEDVQPYVQQVKMTVEKVLLLKPKRQSLLRMVQESIHFKKLEILSSVFEYLKGKLDLPDVSEKSSQDDWEAKLRDKDEMLEETAENFSNQMFLKGKFYQEIKQFCQSSEFYKKHPSPPDPPTFENQMKPEDLISKLSTWKERIVYEAGRYAPEIVTIDDDEPPKKLQKLVENNVSLNSDTTLSPKDVRKMISKFKETRIYKDCINRPHTPNFNDANTFDECLKIVNEWKDNIADILLKQLENTNSVLLGGNHQNSAAIKRPVVDMNNSLSTAAIKRPVVDMNNSLSTAAIKAVVDMSNSLSTAAVKRPVVAMNNSLSTAAIKRTVVDMNNSLSTAVIKRPVVDMNNSLSTKVQCHSNGDTLTEDLDKVISTFNGLDVDIISRLDPNKELFDYVKEKSMAYICAVSVKSPNGQRLTETIVYNQNGFTPCGLYNKNNSCTKAFVHKDAYHGRVIHSCLLCHFVLSGLVNIHIMSNCPLLSLLK